MRKILFSVLIATLAFACGNNNNAGEASTDPPKSMVESEKEVSPADNKGIGEVKNVELNDPLDQEMIEEGKAIYDLKCAACHKLNDQRVVGPGWEGLTKKRTPEWIMNMITNVDIMLEEDPVARQLLEECLVRMPNQNLSVMDARSVLEFMLANDKES